MKRYLFLIVLILGNIIAYASSPKLASEKIFEDIDLYDPSLSITIMERPDQTIHTLSFKNKPDLQKKIKKALDSDKEKAVSKSLVSDNGEISESIIIISDDDEVKIGLSNSRSKEVYFFMQKIHKNNSNNVTGSYKATKTSTNKNRPNSKKKTKTKKTSKTQSPKRIQPLLEDQLLTADQIIETSFFYLLSDL